MAVIPLYVFVKGPIGNYAIEPASLYESMYRWAGSYTPHIHIPIIITSNTNFSNVDGVTGGPGTPESPWIIEDWYFGAGGEGSSLFIANTTDYLVIRDCWFSTASFNKFHAGIVLQNVTNVRLENNNCNDNGWAGVYLTNANNTILTDNWCWDNGRFGIFLEQSNNNTILWNNCSTNMYGIQLTESNNNTLRGNTAINCEQSGINIDGSDNNTLTRNRCAFSHFGLELGNPAASSANIVEQNTPWNTNIGIHILSASGNTIWGNIIEWSEIGIGNYSFSTNLMEGNSISQTGLFFDFFNFYGTNTSIHFGFLGYVLLLMTLGSWCLFLLIIGSPWLKQRRKLMTKITTANDLDHLKIEHEAVISELNKDQP